MTAPRARHVITAVAWLLAALAVAPAEAANTDAAPPVPRFASFKSDEVNLRAGPGQRFPIEWVYRRSGYPVEVIAEFDLWRQIRDVDGTTGWVHQSLLSNRRTALIHGSIRTLRAQPDVAAEGVALAEPGVQVDLVLCQGEWCEVKSSPYAGWLKRAELWGVYPDEAIR
jgi:SH3-like domain-containing protein